MLRGEERGGEERGEERGRESATERAGERERETADSDSLHRPRVDSCSNTARSLNRVWNSNKLWQSWNYKVPLCVCVCVCARACVCAQSKQAAGRPEANNWSSTCYIFMCHLQISDAAVGAVWKELIYVTSFFFFCLVFIWLEVWAIWLQKCTAYPDRFNHNPSVTIFYLDFTNALKTIAPFQSANCSIKTQYWFKGLILCWFAGFCLYFCQPETQKCKMPKYKVPTKSKTQTCKYMRNKEKKWNGDTGKGSGE